MHTALLLCMHLCACTVPTYEYTTSEAHEIWKYASLTIARATCDSLAEGVLRYSIFSSAWHQCLMWLMLMTASASNQMETESEFLTLTCSECCRQSKLSMARAAWLKVICRTRDSKRRILLYLMDFWQRLYSSQARYDCMPSYQLSELSNDASSILLSLCRTSILYYQAFPR
jgi:hypothetical protein